MKPVFRAADLDADWAANARFADAVCEVEADASAINYNGRQVLLRVYPASIAWTPEVDDRMG
ncbi:MAG: hypothetical protein M3541_18405 [Acidobacteriota bacterium]|nr:hypothetical protein [Acidobacteriota bacterium]MDQ3420716.1 hypothetical protein [Acidobacteriota bacterium]